MNKVEGCAFQTHITRDDNWKSITLLVGVAQINYLKILK